MAQLKLHRALRGEFNSDQRRANVESNPLDQAVRIGISRDSQVHQNFLPIMRQLI